MPRARWHLLLLVRQLRKRPVCLRRRIRLLLVLLLPRVRRPLLVRQPPRDLRGRLWQRVLHFRVPLGRFRDSPSQRGRLLLVSRVVKDFRRVPVNRLPARIVPARLMACALLLRLVRVALDSRRAPEVPRRDFRNDREVRVRIRAPSVVKGREPLAEPASPKRSRENLFTRGNRHQRAVARSLKNDSRKARENYIQFARARAPVRAVPRTSNPLCQ